MSETVYSRSPDVVWRLGPDRVLVRRVTSLKNVDDSEQAPADLKLELRGAAALVWIVLDEPATAEVARQRIGEAVLAMDPTEILVQFSEWGLVTISRHQHS